MEKIQLTPEFIDIPEKQLVALSGQFTLETRDQIPALWQRFWSLPWTFEGEEEPTAYGASYSMSPNGEFSYAVGRHITPVPELLPEDACVVTLAAGRYAVFKRRGPVSEIPQVFDAMFSQWLPQSGETQRSAAVFERYPYEDDASPEMMTYEIWLPIVSA